jgi:hypothetical protein
MAKLTLDLPDDVVEMLKALEERLDRLEADKTGVEPAIAERDIDAVTRAMALALKRRSLRGLNVDSQRVLVDGVPHQRVGEHEATYYTKEGPVTVIRVLFRKVGERNGKTVDTVSLRSGAVDGWLPDAAAAAAFLLQQGTSREAQATGQALGVMPYSRSSFERTAHRTGERYAEIRCEIEDQLVQRYEIPERTRSVSVSLDRVSVPFEEQRCRPRGRPRRGAPKRPVTRNWRMAYVGTVTLHDEHGDALHTIRYGRVPTEGCSDMVEGMLDDVKHLQAKRSGLRVVLLTDGAKELVDALDRHFTLEALGVTPLREIDFWHVIEKLAAAATTIHGKNAAAVVARWKMRLLNSKSAPSTILAELKAAKPARKRNPDDECPVQAAMTYLKNQAERMTFVEARAAGLPIGSGNVEATCKSLVGQRLVRTGSRWKQATAQHIVDLRALALSDRFIDAMELMRQCQIHDVRAA